MNSLLASASHRPGKEKVAEEQVRMPRTTPSQNCL